METIIAYYSFTGNNETLAKELQRKLNCDIRKIEEIGQRTNFAILLDMLLNRPAKIKESKAPITQPANFIFIAPIWMGSVATPMRTYIKQVKNKIEEYSFITVCGGANGGQSEKIKKQLLQMVGKEPVTVKELKVNDLLPFDQKNKIKHTSEYRIKKIDLEIFKTEIENFILDVENSVLQIK